MTDRPAQAKGPVDYNLNSATAAQFEILGYLLAHAEHGDVVIVRNQDRGLDARRPDRTGRLTLRG